MPVLELQQRLREIGRIRMGEKGAKGNPVKLDKFRLTSQDRSVLAAAAKIYGGAVRPWQAQPGQFELYITAEELPILVAPVLESQWYEQWTAGGCTHRCDGGTESIKDRPCQCDPEKRDCKLTTRVALMLPELPSLGVWRLESHGYYAATELPTALAMLRNSAFKGEYIPASLAIENRTVVRDGKTKKFPVPVLRLRRVLSDVLNIRGQERQALGQPMQALANGALSLPAHLSTEQKAKSFGLKKEEAAQLKLLIRPDCSLPGILEEAYDAGIRSLEGLVDWINAEMNPTDDDEYDDIDVDPDTGEVIPATSVMDEPTGELPI